MHLSKFECIVSFQKCLRGFNIFVYCVADSNAIYIDFHVNCGIRGQISCPKHNRRQSDIQLLHSADGTQFEERKKTHTIPTIIYLIWINRYIYVEFRFLTRLFSTAFVSAKTKWARMEKIIDYKLCEWQIKNKYLFSFVIIKKRE